MPQPREKIELNPSPDPELDPTLNPLLAANMGRWAAIYSTTPPEKRDQAIHDLLRELGKDSSREAPVPQVRKTGPVAVPEPSPLLTCRACSHNNVAGERFCGMCGALLPVLPEATGDSVADPLPVAERSVDKPELPPGSNSANDAIHSLAMQRDDTPLRSWPQYDLPSFAVEAEPPHHHYRLYVGAALAIILAGVLYMVWRNANTPSGQAVHPAVPNSAPQEQAAPPNAAPQRAANPTTAEEAPATKSALSNSPASSLAKPSARVSSPRKPHAPPPNRTLVATPVPSTTAAPGQSGGEEFATAERYLNGEAGAPRDSGEAAQWLWRAVGKGNLAATVALSDLYLRGDGVPKNCDQGRLLLDAAARKGAIAAAQRLRNLQAFGCQ